MGSNPDPQAELRVAIRYSTVNIPGLPMNRARLIAEQFALSKLSRRLNRDRDFIHCPPDFDSETAKSVWILCDFNISDRVAKVENVPTQFWKVTYDEKHKA